MLINLKDAVYAVPIVVGGLLLLLCLRAVFNASFSSLRSIPGPFWARLTRFWYLKKVWRGDFEKTNIQLHAKYGPIVRIAPNEYSIDDPEAIKVIYGHGTNFIKSPWYVASGNPDPTSHDLFTDRDPKRHAATRRKIANLYSVTSLLQMEPYVQECTQVFLDKLGSFARSGESINMQHWLQCYAFDVIGLITLGKRFGFLDRGEDLGGLLGALHSYLIYCANVGVYSEWHRTLSQLVKLLPGPGMAFVGSFTQEQIAQRMSVSEKAKEMPERTDDFLGKVLRMHEEQPDKFTMTDVFTTCITNIGAGSDTTSISLSGILLNLIKQPSAMQKVRAEFETKLANGDLSRPISYQEALKLPYLQACIKEGLRMHPATGLPLGRVVPKGGATIAGTYFNEGTVVGVNAWVAHHNKNVFGADAAAFKPERWLDDSKELERYFMAFGHGSRTCIGKNISLMEISNLLPEILSKFDFVLDDPSAALQTQNVWFVKQKNFNCKVYNR